MKIAVFVNPRSRANRRNPGVATKFQRIIGTLGLVIAPQTLDEIDEAARGLSTDPPDVIAVHGGDGTLHRLLTALERAFGAVPLPPIAILCGGTMNVVASSLRIRAKAASFLAEVAADARASRPFQTLRRRCLRIDEKLGFIFGNGLMANFLTSYYETGSYGPGRAGWLLFRAISSAVIRGEFARRLFQRFEGTVRVDGVTLDRTNFMGLAAGTVGEVGLGFKLIHRAGDDPDRFGMVAIHAPALALITEFWSVHAGRGITAGHAFSTVAAAMEVSPLPGSRMVYTIDGDLYRADRPVNISMGPPISFVRPASALIVRGQGDTMMEEGAR